MNTIYWHMNPTQGGANLHPGVNLPPGANLHPGANCAHEHGFRGHGNKSRPDEPLCETCFIHICESPCASVQANLYQLPAIRDNHTFVCTILF